MAAASEASASMAALPGALATSGGEPSSLGASGVVASWMASRRVQSLAVHGARPLGRPVTRSVDGGRDIADAHDVGACGGRDDLQEHPCAAQIHVRTSPSRRTRQLPDRRFQTPSSLLPRGVTDASLRRSTLPHSAKHSKPNAQMGCASCERLRPRTKLRSSDPRNVTPRPARVPHGEPVGMAEGSGDEPEASCPQEPQLAAPSFIDRNLCELQRRAVCVDEE